MQWFHVPKEEPTVTFPVGAVIEDDTARYEILEFQKQGIQHKYRVKTLLQKQPIPECVRPHLRPENLWVIVVPQMVEKIVRIS